MPSVGDIYEAKVNYVRGDNTAMNVYFFRVSTVGGTPVDSSDLIDYIQANYIPFLRNILSSAAAIYSIQARNLFDPADFDEEVYGTTYPGLLSGDLAPDFVAAEISQPRLRTDMRRGFKRYPFLSQAVIGGNNFDNSFQAELASVATAIGSSIVVSGTTWRPAIIKRIPYTTVGGSTAYRLPVSLGEVTYYYAQDWQIDSKITHQNTRKSAP